MPCVQSHGLPHAQVGNPGLTEQVSPHLASNARALPAHLCYALNPLKALMDSAAGIEAICYLARRSRGQCLACGPS